MTAVDDPSVPVERARQTGRSDATRSQRRHRWMVWTERYALAVLFAATLLFFSLWSRTSDTFPTTANFQNVLGNQAVIGILSLAIIIPLACGQFDFSVGSVAGLCQCLSAGFMSRLGMPLPVAVLLAIAIGAAIGVTTGNTVARIGVNSLIVTLGLSAVLFGIVQWYTDGQSIITGLPDVLTSAGSGNWFGIPRTLYYLVAIAALVYYVLEHTPFGRYLQSIGSSPEAARLVGLRVDLLVMGAFVLSSTLAALAGVLLVARNGGANPGVGTVNDTLQALSAAFLGATAIKPGRFNVVGTLLAIFFLAFTVTGLSLAGVTNWINDVFNGAALFVAVLVSTIIGRKRAQLA